jgi:hypothetical protein
MADEGSASTLVLVGAILQLLAMLLFAGLALLLLFASMFLSMFDPTNPIVASGFAFFGLFAVMAGSGLFFMILWFVWRSHPSQHRTGLVVSGILGLILAGFLPGLLALIGGAIAPSARELEAAVPHRQTATAPAPKSVNYCPSCGTPITSPAMQFCPSCGTRLA